MRLKMSGDKAIPWIIQRKPSRSNLVERMKDLVGFVGANQQQELFIVSCCYDHYFVLEECKIMSSLILTFNWLFQRLLF